MGAMNRVNTGGAVEVAANSAMEVTPTITQP
jgi:hypothetical protein